MSSSLNNLIQEIYKCGVMRFGDFQLKEGTKTPYYFDLRLLLSSPQTSNLLIDYINNKLVKYRDSTPTSIDRISGVPMGSIPLSTLLSNKMNIPLIMPRKSKKTYGASNEIEGKLEIGDEVLVIEDTVTTGASVLDTIKTIERNGGLVPLVIVVFNRDSGGIENIRQAGYNVLPILHVESFCDVLVNHKLIEEFQYEAVLNFTNVQKTKYMKSLQNDENNENSNDTQDNSQINNQDNETNEENEANKVEYVYNNQKMFNHKLKSTLLDLIYTKKSNLCLSLDTRTWEQGKKILDECGEYVVLVKTHVELYDDYCPNFYKEIREYAAKYAFFVMEDRKLSDINRINWDIMTKSYFNLDNWANFITIQGLTAETSLRYYKEKCDGRNHVNICPVVVAQMSSKDTSFSEEYVNYCVNIINSDDFYSPLVICQDLPQIKNRIKCTPGVCLEGRSEFENNNYRSVDKSMLEQQNHIIIVGSDIIYNDNPGDTAKEYAERSHECFKEGFPDLYKDIETFENELESAIEKLKKMINKNEETNEGTNEESNEGTNEAPNEASNEEPNEEPNEAPNE